MLIFYYGLVVTLFWCVLTVYLTVNRKKVGFLGAVPPSDVPLPPLALIIAVRNEEADLPDALSSVCRLRYPGLRLLLVNDRSTDRTAGILAGFADRFPQLQVITINDLPEGWLGKDHALYRGYLQTDEEWILFSDADVVFGPDTLQHAMRYCLEHRLDHLTVLPYVRSRSEWLNSCLATFMAMLEVRQRPWALRNPNSDASLGIGAFNLVRRTTYEKVGTHAALALRPDDDLQLGRRIKLSGGRQDALYGKGQIGLEWYRSLGEFVRGLMKNTFSVFDYRLWKVILGGVLPVLLVFALPLPLMLLFGGVAGWSMAGMVLLSQWLLFAGQEGGYSRGWFALMVPFAGGLMIYVMIRSALLTLRQGGIYWRDSFYSLEVLRKQKGV